MGDAAHTLCVPADPELGFRRPRLPAPFPPQVNWLDRNLPYHTNFVRFQTAAFLPTRRSPCGAAIDPDFDDPHAVSPLNKQIREQRIAFMSRSSATGPISWRK